MPPISSALSSGADVISACAYSRLLTQAVWKLFFGDRDEKLIHEVGLSRNNDSPTLPSGFNYCAEGLDTGVVTQPGPEADVRWRTTLECPAGCVVLDRGYDTRIGRLIP